MPAFRMNLVIHSITTMPRKIRAMKVAGEHEVHNLSDIEIRRPPQTRHFSPEAHIAQLLATFGTALWLSGSAKSKANTIPNGICNRCVTSGLK